jgi:tetratricopeptide (TPR) repeat protein
MIHRFKYVVIFSCACMCFAIPSTHASPSSRAKSLYRQAVSQLDSGRDYNAAAGMLRQAIQIDPKNPNYHTALGDAYADRASSIAYALAFRQMQAQLIKEYPQDLSDWKDEQTDPKNSYYGVPKPTLPKSRLFSMKDDDKALTLSIAQATFQVDRLASQAEEQWQVALRDASSRLARAKAEESYGWGLRLFDRIHEIDTGSGISLPKTGNRSALSEFEAAVRDNPNSAEYWECIGDDVTAMSGMDNVYWHIAVAYYPSDTAKIMNPGLAAYQRSVAIQPDNPKVWERLVDVAQDNKSSLTEAYLRTAIRWAPNSAVLHYRLAHLLLLKTPYGNILNTPVNSSYALIPQVAKEETKADKKIGQSAVSQIVLGNACPFDVDSNLQASPPMSILIGWQYWDSIELISGPVDQIQQMAEMRDLARQATGFAYVYNYRKDEADSIKTGNAIIEAGTNMAGTWPTKNSQFGSDEVIKTLVAIAVEAIGYKCLEKVAESSGNGDLINQVESRKNWFLSRKSAYLLTLKKNMAVSNSNSAILNEY